MLNEQRKDSYNANNNTKTISNGNIGTKEMINKKHESDGGTMVVSIAHNQWVVGLVLSFFPKALCHGV